MKGVSTGCRCRMRGSGGTAPAANELYITAFNFVVNFNSKINTVVSFQETLSYTSYRYKVTALKHLVTPRVNNIRGRECLMLYRVV